MIVLIALDIGCTALEIHLHDQQQLSVAEQQLSSNDKHGVSSDVAASLLVRVATRLVESFTGFTLFLFLIELVILLAAFRHKFFAHAGYVVDLVVVSLSLAVELYAQTKVARLLGILRVWRVLRLVGKLLDQERAAHDTTRLLLEQEQLKLLHVRMQKDAAHESLKREYESREGIEQLLRGYKDEIVTLKEALQIAAQAVAEATMNETAPVHPKELQSDLGTQYGQENDDDDAAVVHPTEMNGVEEERQEIERVDHYQEATDLNLPGVKTDSEVEHWQESERSENEFEDAVDE
ncbi:hypothetical protein PHPALM_7407 [Phytophthora palmivora]|uniref:Voltage-gated hydrogen channel 1 n=1 Tax=Phytophthora palmivora TaxID=4796 RepID=A0A2P4YCG1_9STRA|nr:hypothetical protein PHPALM_7407 [Phytophthora palmivora]